MKKLNSLGPSMDPLGYSDWPPAGLCAAACNLLSLAMQQIFSAPHCTVVKAVLHQFGVTAGGCVKSLATIAVKDIHSKPHLPSQSSHRRKSVRLVN